MRIQFEITDFGNEGASQKALKEGKVPEEADHLWGAIVLEDNAGKTLRIVDDLTLMAVSLCVLVPQKLKENGAASINMVGWPGDFKFKLSGPTIQVTAHNGEQGSYPADEFFSELQACGLRLTEWMAKLAQMSPQYDYSNKALSRALAGYH